MTVRRRQASAVAAEPGRQVSGVLEALTSWPGDVDDWDDSLLICDCCEPGAEWGDEWEWGDDWDEQDWAFEDELFPDPRPDERF